MRQAAGDPHEGLAVASGQAALDKQMAVPEEIGDLVLEALTLAGGLLRCLVLARRPAPLEFGLALG